MVSKQQIKQHVENCQDCIDYLELQQKRIRNHLKENPNLQLYMCGDCGDMQHIHCVTCGRLFGSMRVMPQVHIYWIKFRKLFSWIK